MRVSLTCRLLCCYRLVVRLGRLFRWHPGRFPGSEVGFGEGDEEGEREQEAEAEGQRMRMRNERAQLRMRELTNVR